MVVLILNLKLPSKNILVKERALRIEFTKKDVIYFTINSDEEIKWRTR
jgi:hypothetical protein